MQISSQGDGLGVMKPTEYCPGFMFMDNPEEDAESGLAPMTAAELEEELRSRSGVWGGGQGPSPAFY